MNECLYSNILGPLIQSLYAEVMIIGMFLAGFGHVRSAIKNPKSIRYGDLGKRILLLASVMIFSIYIILSYNIDTKISSPGNVDNPLLSPAVFLILIAPLELLMVGMAGSMFLVLSSDAIREKNISTLDAKLNSVKSLRIELSFLFAVTAIWHMCCIIWWLFWIGSAMLSIFSIWCHGIAAFVHFSSFFIWRVVSSSNRYVDRQNLFDWVGTIWYFTVMVTIYLCRMYWYVESRL